MSRSREREIDMVRAAIRAEAPYDYRRETRWQYDNRLAAAARDALANEPTDLAHDCESCEACLHDGHKCCGCYDGACCKPGDPS